MPRCPTHPEVELEPKKKGWYCEECDSSVLSYEQLPRERSASVVAPASPDAGPGAEQTLPTMLALPWAEFLHETSPVLAMWAACDFVEIALKVCVMAGLAEHGRQVPDELLRQLRDRVELPTLGKWLGMAQAVARHASPASLMPIAPTIQALSQLLEGEGLLGVRNRLAHGGPVSKAEGAQLISLWGPRLRSFVPSTLGWLGEAQCIAVDDGGRYVLLRGERGQEAPSPADLGRAAPGSVFLLFRASVLALGPLGAFDPSRRAVEVYVRRGEVRLQYLRMGEEGGLCDSDVEALSHFQQLFSLQSKEASPRRTAVRPFDSEIRKEAGRRIGRQRELETLTQAIRAIGKGCLWLGGPAGIGKSNLMAAAMESLIDAPPVDALVLPYRFRSVDDRCHRTIFLTYLFERLEVSGLLAATPDGRGDAGGPDLAADVRRWIDQLRPGARIILLLDGLDEMVERDPTFLDAVVAPLMRDSVVLAGAGRPERGIPEWFFRRSAVEPFPGGLPPMSEDDVRELLLERTGPVRRQLLARDREAGGAMHNAFIARVAQRSEGLPIYVNHVVGDLNAGRVNPENLDSLPASLHDYHDELLRRSAVGDLQAVTTPALVMIALAEEPLSIELLAALLSRGGPMETADLSLVERAVSALAPMLRRAPAVDGGDGYTLFHHSLCTHMLGSSGLAQTVAVMRKALAEAAVADGGGLLTPFLARNAVPLLLAAGRTADAIRLQVDLPRLIERLPHMGVGAARWYSAWDLLLRQGAISGATQAWWEFARLSRHLFRREGWPSVRVLLQAALEQPESSPVRRDVKAFLVEHPDRSPPIHRINSPEQPAASGLLAVFEGHEDVVAGVHLADATTLLSWSRDRTMRLWDLETGGLRVTARAAAGILNGATLLPDGRLLLWGQDGRLHFRDRISGDLLSEVVAHRLAINGVRLLSGDRLLSWSADGSLRLSTLDGASLFHTAAHKGPVKGACLLDDATLLTWSVDRTLRIWSAEDLSGIATMVHGTGDPTADRLPDGRIVSWGSDGVVRWWHRDGRCAHEVDGHIGGVRGLIIVPTGIVTWDGAGVVRHFDAGGQEIARLETSGSRIRGGAFVDESTCCIWVDDGTVRTWDWSARRLVAEWRYPSLAGALMVRPGLLVWSLQGEAALFAPESGRLRTALAGHGKAIVGAVELPGNRVATWAWDRTLRTWSTVPSETMDQQRAPPLQALCGRVDGDLIAISGSEPLRLSADTGRVLARYEGHRAEVIGACPLPDGRLLSWSFDRTLRLWRDLRCERILHGHDGAVTGALLTPLHIVSWSEDRSLRWWDAATGEPTRLRVDHDAPIAGALLLAATRLASWSHEVRLHDPVTGAPLGTIAPDIGRLRLVTALAIPGQSENSLATCSVAISLWDPEGRRIGQWAGHQRSVVGLAFTGDGRLLSWSRDGTLRLWDMDGRCLTVLSGHVAELSGAAILPDQHIVSWSQDGDVRLWSADGGPMGRLHPEAQLRRDAPEGLGALRVAWTMANSLQAMSNVDIDGETFAGLHGRELVLMRASPASGS